MFVAKATHVLFSPTPLQKGAYFGAPSSLHTNKVGRYAKYPCAANTNKINLT